jgi:hypothetical protein
MILVKNSADLCHPGIFFGTAREFSGLRARNKARGWNL